MRNYKVTRGLQYDDDHRRTSRGGGRPPGLKIFRASASCSKILNVKSIFNTVKNFRAHSVFQGKCKLLKNYECKKYIQYSENFQVTLCFQGNPKLLKNPECKKYIQYSEKFQGTLCFFRASTRCSKIVNSEKIFNTVYIHLGLICAIWANVVCNPDQSRN